MKDKVFIDSNIFIYAKVELPNNPKYLQANNFMKNLETDVVISVQVVNEFYNVLSKYKVNDSLIQESILEILRDVYLKTITIDTIKKCWEVKQRYGFSYFDSLIIASALENNCSYLYTEDLQHNQVIDKCLKVVNPFLL